MTRRRIAWLAALTPLVVMTPGPLHGQTIRGPEGAVPPYRLARVVVDGADSVAFAVVSMAGVDDCDGEAVGSTYLLCGAPGRYQVLAFAVKDANPVILKRTVTFAAPAVDPAPSPNPTPGPSPTPKPPPARTELQKIAIEYAYAVPTGARVAAGRVQSGELTEVGQAVAVISAARESARGKLSDAIVAALEGAYDPMTGAITDRTKVAAVLSELGGLLP